MINPDDITDYNRTDRELEEFMVFAICAAGKNANTTAKILNVLFDNAVYWGISPVDYLVKSGAKFLQGHGIGCYNNRYRTLLVLKKKIAANKYFLEDATIAELEEVYGIGPKTARFFIMHSRPNQEIAALDTHILKELRANGIDAPKSTPPAGKKYNQLEQEFIKLAKKSGKTIAEYDLQVWLKYRKTAFDKSN